MKLRAYVKCILYWWQKSKKWRTSRPDPQIIKIYVLKLDEASVPLLWLFHDWFQPVLPKSNKYELLQGSPAYCQGWNVRFVTGSTGPDMQSRGVIPFYTAGSSPVRGGGSHSYSKWFHGLKHVEVLVSHRFHILYSTPKPIESKPTRGVFSVLKPITNL